MKSKRPTVLPALLLTILSGPSVAGDGDALASPEVTAVLQPYLDQCKLAGAIAVIADRTGQVHYKNLLGYADVEAKKPISEDNVFWVASMTKMFAGASVMMLVDEGKVSLDDPVTKFITQLNKWMVVEEKDSVPRPAETPGPARHNPAPAQPHERPGRNVGAPAGHGGGQHPTESPCVEFGDRPAPVAARRQVRLWQSGDERRRPGRRGRRRYAV